MPEFDRIYFLDASVIMYEAMNKETRNKLKETSLAQHLAVLNNSPCYHHLDTLDELTSLMEHFKEAGYIEQKLAL